MRTRIFVFNLVFALLVFVSYNNLISYKRLSVNNVYLVNFVVVKAYSFNEKSHVSVYVKRLVHILNEPARVNKIC